MKTIWDLQNCGLTSNEARVYVSLLKMTEATVYAIAKDVVIPRTTVYEILDTLKQKNLVSVNHKNGKKHFVAESPNRLLRNLEDKIEITKDLIPSLFAISRSPHISPKVKLFLGESGKKAVLDDILESCEKNKTEPFYAIAGLELPLEVNKYLISWIKKKEQMGLKNCLLANDDGSHKAPKIYPNNAWRETRLMPKDLAFDTTMDIYANKIAIFSKVENIDHSIIIESPSIYETFRKFFLFMWRNADQCENQ